MTYFLLSRFVDPETKASKVDLLNDFLIHRYIIDLLPIMERNSLTNPDPKMDLGNSELWVSHYDHLVD